MKKLLFISCVLAFIAINSNTASAQRYLTNTFPGVDSTVNIPYGLAKNYLGQDQTLLLDFYQPKGDKIKKRPLFIYVHGGGFKEGTRKWPSIRIICEKMALRGYAVASIDYRLDPTFNLLQTPLVKGEAIDAMHDLKAAMRFFKANRKKYGIDTANIIISGESAGAITIMMASYIDSTNELAAYGKADPYTVQGNSGNPGFSTKPKAAVCLCGLMLDTTAIKSAKSTPLLWIHGSKDPLIPISWAEKIITRAQHVGLPYKKYVYQGATHCPWYYGLPKWQSYLDSTVNYVSEYLYPVVKTTGK